MTDDERISRNSPAWQRYRAARTLAHHATDATDLARLLDMLGLSAAEGREPPEESAAADPTPHPVALGEDSAGRLNGLLREAYPARHRRAG
ncbi:MAG: hypothetical protein GEV28_15810 [Actinophytocola sp.]|uniref:hypothetical protein n=1 Tax=Actinophytocola sp. TaxID=1872138 RepID=UPI001329CCDD|nr:hypothetical protein [Actinophytocola sp.]MPZ81783.1 hypothetical protein [Actinophytocola sp.]